MSQDLVRRIKNVLNSQHYFMNNDWLSDCVQFYVGQNSSVHDQQIINFVKSQWELSDLREINNENGCLPQNLTQQKVTTLRSTYILQMEKVYDASTSKYKQLEQIRNISTGNIEVTENEEKLSWEPKKKRMLYLYLTDGIQNITAMEYEPMKCLSDSILPGRKVMIVGPIQCRRGVILLQQGKFKELGGEVESLLIPNFVENVLARALDLPQNPDPYNNNNDNRNVNNDRNINEENYFEDEFDIDLEQVSEIERKSQELGSNYQVRSTQQYTTNTTGTLVPSAAKRKERDQKVNQVPEFDDEDLLEMLEDDEIYCPLPKESIKKKENNDFFPNKKMNSGNNIQKCSVPINAEDINAVEDLFVDDFDMDNIDTMLRDASPPKASGENKVICEDPMIANTQQITNKTSPFNKIFSISPSTSTSIITKPEPTISKNLSPVGMVQKTLSKVTPTISGNKKLSVSSPNTKVSKILPNQEEQKGNNGDRKISEFIGRAATTVKPDLPKICDFICDVIAQNITDTTFYTVRGRTVHLGKLSKKDGCWQLDGTITDKTASLDVTFSPQVLENMIGLSVKQFSEKRKLSKFNPALEQELRMYCRNAELKLKQIDALMELEVSGPDMKSKVVSISPLSENQKEIIDKRLKLLRL